MKKTFFVTFLIIISVLFNSVFFVDYALAAVLSPTPSVSPTPTPTPTPAPAGLPTKMMGNAWAPNFGWLNFGDGTTAFPAVTVNQTTGTFSGYGWSPNIGLIRIDPTLTGPANKGDNYGIKAVQSATPGQFSIKGWMRACSAFSNPSLCSGADEKDIAGTERGGWDGWFKLKDVVFDKITRTYSGFSWGDLVGGWVNFSTVTEGIVPSTVSCDSTVAPDGLTITWSAEVLAPSGLYSYLWMGSGSVSSDSFTALVLNVLTSTYTKEYVHSPSRQVSATVWVMQGGTIIGTCPSASVGIPLTSPSPTPSVSPSPSVSPTPSVSPSPSVSPTPGGPNGSVRRAFCTASLSGTSVNWQANGDGITPPSTYKWTGYTKSGSVYTSNLSVGLNSQMTATPQTTYIVNSAGRVTIKDASNHSATSDYCDVQAPVCKIKVNYQGADQGRDFVIDYPTTGYTKTVDCGPNTLQTNSGSFIWWTTGACLNPANYTLQKTANHSVTATNGTKNVCADWGGVNLGQVEITGGVTKVNCGLTPCYYTDSRKVFSTPVGIRNPLAIAPENVTVTHWGDFDTVAGSCDENEKPQLCIGAGNSTCITAGDTNATLPITTTAQALKFYFPSKCSGSNGISVFHRPAGPNWTVTLQGSGNAVHLNLYFNDPYSANN